MRLTLYTDYTLRVMIYLSVRYRDGGVATIDEMATAYGISRSHLTKIVHELGQHGFIETVRGRSGGARLARAPQQISVGEVVRMAEKDFAVVACHDTTVESDCAVFQACNLKRGMRRAVDAFMHELDKMTFADAITVPQVAASLLGVPAEAPMAMPRPGSGRRAAAR
ncbi:RrF2 family transcriptional regulator [Aquabacterium humicola]|uniref:RrF2 family transcriptional regulator n=1 Tax=Aquabacterium humicola TaxID=3237377 RepID=UPI002542D955|nr:Rrf2 family transcriptional regulator [Rubrivivax pictus]